MILISEPCKARLDGP